MQRADRMNGSLWTLSWPIMLSIAMSVSQTITDTLFMSRVSDAAAAAVGALLPVLVLAGAVFAVLGQAGCAVAGQLLGARQDEQVPATYGALLLLNVGIGLFFSLVVLSVQDWLPGALGLRGQAQQYAQTYLAWISFSQVLSAGQQAAVNILNSRGATRWTLAQAALAALLNVSLNLLFLTGRFGPLDLQKIAFATFASKLLACLLAGLAIRSVLAIPIVLPRTLSALRRAQWPVLRIGLPSVAEPVAFELSRIFLTTLVIAMGPAQLAARVYVYNLTFLPIIWSIALSVGTQILIAYRIGECRFEDAHRQLLQSFRWALFGSVGLVILLNLLQEPILGAFTQDQEIQRLCGPLLLLSIPLEVGRTSNIVAGGALRASGDARYVGVMGSCVMWLFAVPLAAFLCLRLNLGLIGIWVAMAADECVRGAFNLLRWNSGMWRRYGVLKLLPEH